MLVNKIDASLSEIYPSYLKLREKYLTAVKYFNKRRPKWFAKYT